MNALLVGVMTGVDNLALGAALGLLPLTARRRAAFAGAFALAEVGMALLGRFVLVGFAGELPGAFALALAGTLALAGALGGQQLARYAGHPLAVALLPLALSLDNLAGGAALGAAGTPGSPAELAAGVTSAALAACGVLAGGALRRFGPRTAAAAGVAMLLLSVPGFLAGPA